MRPDVHFSKIKEGRTCGPTYTNIRLCTPHRGSLHGLRLPDRTCGPSVGARSFGSMRLYCRPVLGSIIEPQLRVLQRSRGMAAAEAECTGASLDAAWTQSSASETPHLLFRV